MELLLNLLADAFRDASLAEKIGAENLDKFLNGLESGEIRAAKKINGAWQVDERVKQGILLCFRKGINEKITLGPLTFIDKHNLWPRSLDMASGIRLVPGGVSVRRGAFLGARVTLMPPSFVNIGAFVDDGSMVDSHALVGSCAQVGKRVHISAGAQIGGVLEPIGLLPVIIEDEVMLGGNTGIFEGVIIGKGAVIGAGVNITSSSKIYDLVNEQVIEKMDDKPLIVPEGAVVITGSRGISNDFAIENRLSIVTPIIVKYRDQKTEDKTKHEDDLRR